MIKKKLEISNEKNVLILFSKGILTFALEKKPKKYAEDFIKK